MDLINDVSGEIKVDPKFREFMKDFTKFVRGKITLKEAAESHDEDFGIP